MESKAEQKRLHSHLNADHIPDVIRYGDRVDLYEVKCYSPYKKGGGALGLGSSALGGAASTSDGHKWAFGNTLEALRTIVFGHAESGEGRPFDRRTGIGRLSHKRGHYTDAVEKGHGVHLLVTECTGAMSHQLVQLLRTLSRVAGAAGNHDTTIYGTSRSSPRKFYQHHLAAVSAAIVTADAKVIATATTEMNKHLTHGNTGA